MEYTSKVRFMFIKTCSLTNLKTDMSDLLAYVSIFGFGNS